MQEEKSLHYILGASLAAIAVFVVVALVMINSQASTSEVDITNSSPTIVDIYYEDEAYGQTEFYSGTIDDLAAGTTITRYVTGTVQDLNGNGDIETVELFFGRDSMLDSGSCTPDKNNCYQVATCDLQTNGNDDQKDFSCTLALNYFMDSTSTGGVAPTDNWEANIAVWDGVAQVTSTLDIEVETLMALSIPGSIDYGTLALGASTTTSDNQLMTITQTGNDEADVEVSSAAAMTCTHGTIPVANQEWSLTDVDYGTGTDLSGSAADTNLNVAYQTSDTTPTTGSVYWNIAIPSTTVGGTCTGTTTITALAH